MLVFFNSFFFFFLGGGTDGQTVSETMAMLKCVIGRARVAVGFWWGLALGVDVEMDLGRS